MFFPNITKSPHMWLLITTPCLVCWAKICYAKTSHMQSRKALIIFIMPWGLAGRGINLVTWHHVFNWAADPQQINIDYNMFMKIPYSEPGYCFLYATSFQLPLENPISISGQNNWFGGDCLVIKLPSWKWLLAILKLKLHVCWLVPIWNPYMMELWLATGVC